MNSVVDALMLLVEEDNSTQKRDLSEYEEALAKYGDQKKSQKYELALSGISYLEYNSNYQFSTAN